MVRVAGGYGWIWDVVMVDLCLRVVGSNKMEKRIK